MKKLLTFLTLLMLFFGVGWANTMTFTATSKTEGTLSGAPNGVSYTLSGGNQFTSGQGVQVTKNASPFTATFSGLSSSYKVTSIVVTYCTNASSGVGTISAKIGSNQVGSTFNVTKPSSGGTTLKTATLYSDSEGTAFNGQNFVITVTCSTNSVYFNKVTVEYEENSSTSGLSDPGISFSGFTEGSTNVTATITPDENATTTYYKIGENGTYTALPSSGEVSVDLTTNASPVKVYAYSTDGTNTTDPVYQEFTVPALGVNISPSSYTGYSAQTVTITPSNYVGDYAITYTINGGTDIDYSAPFTLSDPGTYEIVATVLDDRADATEVTKTSTITINEAEGVNLPFVETFDGTEGTGGNDNSWNGSVATNAIVYDNEGWSVSDKWGGDQCIRLGTSSKKGTITSPTIKGLTVGQTYTLTFKAAPWGTTSTVMNVTASGATVSGLPETAMTSEQWNDFTVTLTATSTTTTLTFTTNQNRFWLDEVNVTEQSTTVADGYYLFGQFNDWATGDSNYKFTQQSDGSYKLTVSNYTANNQFKFAKYENGTATLIGVSNDGNNYGLHSTHHTDIAMNTGDDTYSINDSGEMIFTIHADETAFDVDKQVYMKGTYNSWVNEAMTLTANGWTITKQLAADAELGFVDSWGSGIWHGCGDNQNNLTVDQSKLDTDLSLWTDGKNFYFPTAGNYSFTVSRDLLKVVISLVPESYAITCTATPEGTGTVTADKATATAGETVTLTVTPSNSNYEVVSVTVNDEAITPVEGVYSFTMPAADVNVVATFAKIQYTITKAETNCTISFTDGVTENNGTITSGPGDEVKFTVTPITSKYVVSSVIVTWPDGSTTNPTLAGGVYSFTMQGRNAVVTAICVREAVGDGSFVLVTDATTLNAGDKVIITNSKTVGSLTAVAMSTTQNDNNRGEAEVTIVDGPKITPSASVQVFTLEGDANGWYFNTGNGYIYAASSTKNYLRTEITKDDNAKAEISITNDVASIVFQGTNTRNVLQYNTSGMFSCYSSASQSDVYLFKQTAAGLMVDIDPNGGEVIGSQEVTIDANVEGAMVQYKIGNDDWSTPAEAPVTTTITGNVGDNVVVYAKATVVDDDETLEDETDATFHFVAPDAPSITPASQSIIDVKQNVTIESGYTNGTIEYSIDGGTTWTEYDGAFDVYLPELGSSVTVQARVTVNGVTSEVASATYTRNVQPVVFSPVSGTYYYGTQSVEMFSITPGARIYYTMTNDGTDPADPVMGTGTLYTGPIENLEAGKTYKFKAYAYIGTINSTLSTAEYTIEAHDTDYWQNVAAMNADNGSVTKYFENPLQVVYMSTYQNNGNTPEFCYVRDNSGYGLIYFAKNHTSYNSYTKFSMGDWLGAKTIEGKTDVWYDGFHNELGNSSGAIYEWPSTTVGNTAILPEEVTNAQIKAGWDAAAYASGSAYKDGVTGSSLWGHYVHLRKNQITNLTTVDSKYKGIMTDENGDVLTYYDAFYKFSGFGTNAKEYNSDFYTSRQNKGATFDFYGVVAFYGPDVTNATYANQPFQIVPLDILWIYKPVISGVNSTDVYASPQTVTLSLDPVSGDDESNSVIWYKTSEMDDYAIYTGPFEVSTSTTIETYTTKMTSYNDRMESLVTTMDVHFTTINPPEISPESTVKAVGSESINSTITRDESDGLTNVVIFFTIDGSDPSDPNCTRYEYTTANQATYLSDIRTTTTVRAIAAVYNQATESYVYSAEADAKTYTFVKSNGIVYDLVTNVSQLTSTGVYVIVSRAHSEAMSNVQNTNNRGAAGVMFVDNTQAQVYGNDDVAVFTLTPLTDASDTGSEKHFLFQTNNGKTSDATGYIYVGSNDDNTLLTEAEEDAMANDVAVVTIDADGRAHIRFNYAGGDNRYLQYWNRDRLFSTYKNEYNDRAVYIYYKNATPLATIEKEGTNGNDYTVADELVGVYASGKLLWCKDQGNVSINKSELNRDNGEIDFLHDVVGNPFNTAWEDCDQSNWVILDFSDVTEGKNDAEYFVNKFIAPATVTGTYNKGTNYTIKLKTAPNDNEGSPSFTKNIFVASSFAEVYQAGVNNRRFLNPKGTEVHTLTFAVWDGANFTTPSTTDLPGVVSVDWTYNKSGDVSTTLEVGTQYEFIASVGFAAASNSPRLKAEAQTSTTFKVQPLNLTSENVITGINTIAIDGSREVKSVKYVNVAGVVSDKPFSGVNIVVTEYTDGSRSTTKMLCK